jgi:Flp pilus assembly protein TadD
LPNPLISEVQHLLDMGKYDEAKEKTMEILSSDPENAEAYNKLGVILIREKKLEEAKTAFTKALELKPRFSSAACNLGNLYFESGDMASAEQLYEHAIEYDPDNPVPYNNLAVIYRKQHRLDESVKCYKKSINLKFRRDLRQDSNTSPNTHSSSLKRLWYFGIPLAVLLYLLITAR